MSTMCRSEHPILPRPERLQLQEVSHLLFVNHRVCSLDADTSLPSQEVERLSLPSEPPGEERATESRVFKAQDYSNYRSIS